MITVASIELDDLAQQLQKLLFKSLQKLATAEAQAVYFKLLNPTNLPAISPVAQSI